MDGRPNYISFDIDLTAAGSRHMDFQGSRLFFVRAQDSGGLIVPSALVEVALGESEEDYIPLSMNSRIIADARRYWFRWAAQDGVTATFILSRSAAPSADNGLYVDAPPAVSAVVGDLAAALNVARAAMSTTAGVVVSANANRRALTVRNQGGVSVFLDDNAAVATATGFELSPGAEWRTRDYRGPLYGITASGAASLHVMEETN